MCVSLCHKYSTVKSGDVSPIPTPRSQKLLCSHWASPLICPGLSLSLFMNHCLYAFIECAENTLQIIYFIGSKRKKIFLWNGPFLQGPCVCVPEALSTRYVPLSWLSPDRWESMPLLVVQIIINCDALRSILSLLLRKTLFFICPALSRYRNRYHERVGDRGIERKTITVLDNEVH